MVAGVDVVEALATFTAVARERSFTRGAARLGQPQPVASRRIAALEARWGVALLRRSSRQVELTADGARLLPLADDVLARLDRIESLFSASPDELVIAVPHGVDARARATVRRGLPDRQVAFETVPAGEREERIHAGRADLALVPSPGDAGDLAAPLGLASATPEVAVHWTTLRRPLRPRGERARRVHLRVEDDVAWVREPVRAAAAGAGLRADQVATGTADDDAWTAVHEWDDVVVATAAEAERERLHWTAVRPGLTRGWRLVGAGDLDDVERAALVRRLARGLGATS